MSNYRNPRKIKRKRRRKKGPYLAILIVLIYFISRMPPLLGSSAQGTYAAEYGKIEKTIESTGYIIREEELFTGIGQGDIKYFVSEGERVTKGQKLAEVYLEQLDEKSRKDLEIINLRLQNIKEKQDEQDEQGVFKGDIEKLEQQISILIKSIQQELKDRKYDKIVTMKKELEDLLDKKSIIVGVKSFSGKNINQLEQQKSQLENKVNSSVQIIYSDSSGFVSMGSDGLEELLNYRSLHEVTGKQLEMLKDATLKPSSKDAKDTKDTKEGLTPMRIIKNYKWSIIAEVDTEQGKKIEKGSSVKIRTMDQNRELKSTVRNVLEEGDKKIVIFDLDEFIGDFYNIRTLTVEIIQSQYEGAMVANSSIVEKDGIEGVYTVDINGVPQFKPIKIKVSNAEYSILYDSYFEQNSKDDSEKIEQIKTINLYDEIVMNGVKVKEGRRIK